MESVDPAVEILNKFLAEKNLDLKLAITYNGEQSQGAAGFLNRLMQDNNLGVSIQVSFKPVPISVLPPTPPVDPVSAAVEKAKEDTKNDVIEGEVEEPNGKQQ